MAQFLDTLLGKLALRMARVGMEKMDHFVHGRMVWFSGMWENVWGSNPSGDIKFLAKIDQLRMV